MLFNAIYLKRKKRVISKTIISIALLCLNNAMAQETLETPEPSNWQVLLQLDNDLFAGSDRDYTNGVRVGFVQEIPFDSDEGKRMNKRLLDGSKKLQGRLQSMRMPKGANLRFARGFGISQLMFTPEDPLALKAPEGERPYAGWLGLEYSLHVKADNYVNSLTLSVGTTGESSLAQPSQNWVHRNISNSPLFQGWDSQIPSELTVNIHFDHKQRFRGLSKLTPGGLEVDGYYEGGLAAGNFRTDTYIGGLARIGYRLPSSFSTPRVELGSYGHQLFSDTRNYGKKFSGFAFAGLRATAVLHDITLDGPVFRNFNTDIESESLVGELLYGVGFRYKKVALIFSQTIRSDEFTGQTENQKFGSFMLRFQSGLN
jgi:lipid A 3-O-deacylase